MPLSQKYRVTSAVFDLDVHRSDVVPAMERAHRHHEVEINYLEAGQVDYLTGGRRVRVPAGRFGFFWASVPHRVIGASADARGFWYVTIPLPWVLSWGLPPALLGRLLDGDMLSDAASRVTDPGRLAEWRDALHDRDRAARVPVLLLEMEARFRRFALDNPDARRAAGIRGGRGGGKVERMARFVVEHFDEPLTLADIAAAADLHPNYAATLFRQYCGQTPLQCLNQHRIAAAQRLLATTDAKVLDVAMQSGFGSLSRFYEAFNAACGQTPAVYRERFQRSLDRGAESFGRITMTAASDPIGSG